MKFPMTIKGLELGGEFHHSIVARRNKRRVIMGSIGGDGGLPAGRQGFGQALVRLFLLFSESLSMSSCANWN